MAERIVHTPAVFAGAVTSGSVKTDFLTVTGTWQYPFRIGSWRIWADESAGALLKKQSADPTFEADGIPL